MLLFELEREIAPLSRGEQFELMRFLLNLLAESDADEDRRDAELIESRRGEPTYALADVLAERRKVTA